jgi:hypothetical protein
LHLYLASTPFHTVYGPHVPTIQKRPTLCEARAKKTLNNVHGQGDKGQWKRVRGPTPNKTRGIGKKAACNVTCIAEGFEHRVRGEKLVFDLVHLQHPSNANVRTQTPHHHAQ